MRLTPHDLSSSTWQKLQAHYTPLLAKLRARIENPDLPETQRTPLLWQIKFIKDFLEMAEPDQKKVTAAD